jgi:hypothetical protein
MMNPMMVLLTVVFSPQSLGGLEPRARIGHACFRQPNAEDNLLVWSAAAYQLGLSCGYIDFLPPSALSCELNAGESASRRAF